MEISFEVQEESKQVSDRLIEIEYCGFRYQFPNLLEDRFFIGQKLN